MHLCGGAQRLVGTILECDPAAYTLSLARLRFRVVPRGWRMRVSAGATRATIVLYYVLALAAAAAAVTPVTVEHRTSCRAQSHCGAGSN